MKRGGVATAVAVTLCLGSTSAIAEPAGADEIAAADDAVGGLAESAGVVPVVPVRLLDTREGTGAPVGKVTPGGVVELSVTGGASGVAGDALAVVLNVTATEVDGPGYVTVWPCGFERPTASNLNVSAGVTVPNLVVAKVGVGGKVCLYSLSGTHLIADLNAWFPASAGVVPVVPVRLLDTREGTGAPVGKVTPGGVVELSVTGGASGVAGDALAVVLNVTATEVDGPGYVTVWPCGFERPTASNLNVSAGVTVPNLVVAKVGVGGKVCLYSLSGTHLIADLNAWFPASAGVVPVVPVRLLDTREGTGAPVGKVTPGGVVELSVTGGASGVAGDALAVVLNVTATEVDGPGYVTVWPCGFERPTASNLNVSAGVTVPNLVVAKVGVGGKVCLYSLSGTHLLADLNAWFHAPSVGGALADTVLAAAPRVPSDVALFTSIYANGGQGFYPTGPAMVPASGPVLTELEVRGQLQAYLAGMYPAQPATISSALEVFDNPDVETIVTDPPVRAALAAQVGTAQESALDLLDRFAIVRYGGLPQQGAIAGSTGGTDNRVVFVNSRYRFEDFRYLVGIMAHELFHHDSSNTQAEEAVLNTLSALDYMRVLLVYPDLAHTGTELSRQMNDLALIYLNSRESGSPVSEIYAPTGSGVAPGSPRNAPDVWTIFGASSTTSIMPPGLSEVLATYGIAGTTSFSLQTASAFDQINDDWITDVNRVQLSVLLELIDVAEISALTGLTEFEAVSHFELQPFLDAAA